MRKILVTGGCGYKGSVLVPKLLSLGHEVIVVDTQWFGCYLPRTDRLQIHKKEIGDLVVTDLNGVDIIIHLASIANDPSGELVAAKTWEISALATLNLANMAKAAGVRQFIYASSGSVYGIKTEARVTEDLTLKPISIYNKTKMVAESILAGFTDDFCIQIVRPATVCGLSPRMRLDVAVNMLTWQALTTGRIRVLGGEQFRPNIHIEDITDLYLFLLGRTDLEGIFNAGFENITITDLAEYIQSQTGAELVYHPSNDPRSYRIDSTKICNAGFTPRYCVEDAVNQISEAYRSGALMDDERWHTVPWMKLKGYPEK